MSDDASARLGLPYLAAGQLQKHVTLNEALTRLDALIQTAVVSRTTTQQPSDPVEGALYILPEAATGADWAAHPAGSLLRHERGGWLPVPALDGLLAVVLDSEEILVRRAGVWTPLSFGLPEEIQQITRLGVNTTADATNMVAVRANKTLWTALENESGGDGDLRFTFNKQGAGDVLSLLFQSGWGGRAELGLVGDDDLRLKVSPDGGAWHEALRIDRSTGRAWFGQGATRRETTVLTTSASWTPPVWARWIEAVCVGGGGGGGAGLAGASGTARHGGGGGGAGGVMMACWPAVNLSGGLDVTVGGGGAGGAASGAAGGQGAASLVNTGAQVLLTGEGRRGGAGGSEASGAGGAGGGGLPPSNAGGASSVSAAGAAGQATARPDGPGAGGGLSTADAAQVAGSGGDGALLVLKAAGGTTEGEAGQTAPWRDLHWADVWRGSGRRSRRPSWRRRRRRRRGRDGGGRGRRRRGRSCLADGGGVRAMIRRLHRIIGAEEALSLGELEPLLDEEVWAAPDRLSTDDCFDHLGGDWRSSAAPHDPEDGR